MLIVCYRFHWQWTSSRVEDEYMFSSFNQWDIDEDIMSEGDRCFIQLMRPETHYILERNICPVQIPFNVWIMSVCSEVHTHTVFVWMAHSVMLQCAFSLPHSLLKITLVIWLLCCVWVSDYAPQQKTNKQKCPCQCISNGSVQKKCWWLDKRVSWGATC